MFYLVKTPWWLKQLYPYGRWKIPGDGKKIYLTFDDGPHPDITPFVLECLQKHRAKATFFCIGKNVVANPHVAQMILAGGHRIGNHTQNHLNGWKTSDDVYIENVQQARQHIDSALFRPPYGRIRKSQVRKLKQQYPEIDIIMWDVLSADFDISIDARQCIDNVMKHTRPGSIIVFHDSEKAFPRLQKALPVILDQLASKGYVFELIP